MKKIMLLVFLGLFVFFVSNVSALAPNCIIDTRQLLPPSPPNIDRTIPGMDLLGYISGQGHYSNTYGGGNVTFSHALFCFENFTNFREDGEPAFKFSDPNTVYTVGGDSSLGSGHVAKFNSSLDFRANSTVYFGDDKCTIRASCQVDEVCVARISGSEQGHLADCNDNRPVLNNYANRICCEPTEYCRDDIDNTGDGLVDCASPQCHPSPQTLDRAMECTNNTQRSSDCITVGPAPDYNIVVNPACVNGDDTFYCSYGEFDDGSQTGGRGFCCPAGEYARLFDPFTPELGWTCAEPTQCGVGATLPPFNCNINHITDFADWVEKVFISPSDQWCISQLPNYYNPITNLNDRSMGCCFIAQYGDAGFYYDSDNVKIFGSN